MDTQKNLETRIIELGNELDEEKIKSATDEELMAYLFLAEKMKTKLEKLSNIK